MNLEPIYFLNKNFYYKFVTSIIDDIPNALSCKHIFEYICYDNMIYVNGGSDKKFNNNFIYIASNKNGIIIGGRHKEVGILSPNEVISQLGIESWDSVNKLLNYHIFNINYELNK